MSELMQFAPNKLNDAEWRKLNTDIDNLNHEKRRFGYAWGTVSATDPDVSIRGDLAAKQEMLQNFSRTKHQMNCTIKQVS